jgi:hypothetical protein
MHESERNRRTKLHKALLLAASDVTQAQAALHALENEPYNVMLRRALETAISVCYARAFTKSTLKRLSDEYAPTPDDPNHELHLLLCEHRNKVYAHTDKESGRSSSVRWETTESDVATWTEWQETWTPFPRDLYPRFHELFQAQRNRFLDEGVAIQHKLDTET